MNIRRVVTGHDKNGKAVFVADEQVEPLTVALLPGGEYHRLWGSDHVPTFPDDGAPPAQPGYFPPVGGYRFCIFTIAPGGRSTPPGLDLEAARREMDAKLPGLSGLMEPDNPGMHTTDTVDLEMVLSGEIVLELDDGAEKVLRAGDTLIQNGTRHRWANRGTEPATIVMFATGAHRSGPPKD